MDARAVPPKNVHVNCRRSESIGLTLGRKIGRLDPTTQPTTSDKFDKGEWDALHRQLTVVDSYSAAVDLEELQRGRVDVVIQALGAEEMLLCVPPERDDGLPPPGLQVWKHVFEGVDLVERVSQIIDEHLRFVQAYDDYIGLALREEDVRRLVSQGKVACGATGA